MSRDEIYRKPFITGCDGDHSEPEFVFDERVVAVFDDMIERSVPTYAGSLEFIAKVWERWQKPEATLLDLGCSTGAALRKIIDVTRVDGVKLLGVDSSAPMIEKARNNLAPLAHAKGLRLEFQEAKLEDLELPPADGALLNYTLQFVAPEDRLAVLKRIRRSLVATSPTANGSAASGFLVLSEKIRHADSQTGELLNEIHFDFKRSQGYSDLEIARKRAALENVLIPWTLEENVDVVRAAGFSTVHVVLLWCNFVTILARV